MKRSCARTRGAPGFLIVVALVARATEALAAVPITKVSRVSYGKPLGSKDSPGGACEVDGTLSNLS